MARTNKYSSINYNHIYERNLTNNNNPSKQPSSSSSSSSSSVASYSAISSPNAYKNHLSSSSSRTHGRMLVLTRPAAKPVSFIPNTSVSPSPQIPLSTQQPSQVHVSDQNQNRNRNEPDSDQISLRPLGRTGSAATCGGSSSPILFHPERENEILSPKPNKFVPPHLRPGFAGKEERPGPEVYRGKEASPRVHHPSLLQQQQQGFFASSDGGRPKSGGYERIRRGGGGETDLGLMNRPRSSGNRPNSSG